MQLKYYGFISTNNITADVDDSAQQNVYWLGIFLLRKEGFSKLCNRLVFGIDVIILWRCEIGEKFRKTRF